MHITRGMLNGVGGELVGVGAGVASDEETVLDGGTASAGGKIGW